MNLRIFGFATVLNFDRVIRPNSRISRFPRFAQPLAIFIRSVFGFVIRKLPMTPNRYHYHFDSVATVNNTDFMDDAKFQVAYNSLVRSYCWDPGLPWRVHQVMWAVEQTRDVEGSWIEFGVGRGGLMSAALTHHGSWNESGRDLHLFDTFLPFRLNSEGNQISSSSFHPNPLHKNDQLSTKFKYYASSLEVTVNNFAEFDNVNFHVGNVFETLPNFDCPSLSFVSIDLNYAPAEEFVLNFIYDRISRGGVIILDDYAAASRVKQREAYDKQSKILGFSILRTPSGQGIVVKR